jgi:NitT/TauT family transport system substrate-binding protein
MQQAIRRATLTVAALLLAACAAPASRPSAPSAASPPAAATGGSEAPGTWGPVAAPASANATTGPSPATPLNPRQRVRVISIGLAGQAPTYIAVERGYFEQLGLDVELVTMATINEVVALLSSDQLDVGFTSIAAGIFNAVARDVGIRMVADHGSNIVGRATPSLAVRADLLAERPWTGYQDLKGMKIALLVTGSLTEYYLERMLQRGGLSLGDVEIVAPLPLPDMAVGFANKAIDAAIYNEPWATQQEQAGVIKKVIYTDDVDPNGHIAAVLFSETFARNTAAARNYMVGYLRGVRDYWDAYDGRQDFQIVVDVMKKHTPLKDESLIRKIPPTGQQTDGHLDAANLAIYQDWFAERGLVPQKIDVRKAIDSSFVEYANSVLGPYQPVANPRRPN